MIKVLVVLLGVAAYFNVTQFIDIQQLKDHNTLLQETIVELEKQQLDETDTCQKLHEITIVVTNSHEDFSQSYVHCTNAIYLGDALDEIQNELQVVYDPNYNRDYVYGRMVHSFYGFSKDFEEYYEISINGEYATVGLDFIEIDDNISYGFTLVRWS
jgi:predicted patatin/cPLA2 family phospholipase